METALITALTGFLASPTALGALVLGAIAFAYAMIRVAMAASRTGDAARDMVTEVRALPAKLDAHQERQRVDHDQTRAAIVAVDRRVDELARQLTAAVGADGQLTREALEDKRLSEVRQAAEASQRAAEEAVRISSEHLEPTPPPRRQRSGSHPSMR